MKIRTDFVTNSSSSSFILGFKSKADIQKTLEKQLSWARDYKINSYGYGEDDESFDAFEKVYNDCLDAEKMDFEKMIELYKEEREWSIAYSISEHHPKTQHMTWNERYDWQQSEECKELVKKELDKEIENLKKKHGQKIFVQINYSDHTSEGSSLEHEIVPNLDCCIKRFSYH